MSWLFPVIYVIGMIVVSEILRRKAGIRHGRRIPIVGSNGVGIKWFAVSIVKTLFWPVTVAVWAVRAAAR